LHVSNGQWTFHGVPCHHLNGKNFNDWDQSNEFFILKTQKNKIMTRVHKLVVQFLNTCHIFISYIVVARRVVTRCNYIWINMYGWTCILAPYIYVAYVMSRATCLMQLHKFAIACVACNWILVANDNCKTQNF
jgi:hypothetical protein